jgi:hypothetical protein
VAKIEIKMPEDFLLRISRLADKTDEIIPRVLEAGGKVVLDKVKSNLPPWSDGHQGKKADPPGNWSAPSVFPPPSKTATRIGM